MKIFSLESKTSLMLWSVALGVVITFILTLFYRTTYVVNDYSSICKAGMKCIEKIYAIKFGWPVALDSSISWSLSKTALVFISNSVFWFLVIFIILSLISYFQYKN